MHSSDISSAPAPRNTPPVPGWTAPHRRGPIRVRDEAQRGVMYPGAPVVRRPVVRPVVSGTAKPPGLSLRERVTLGLQTLLGRLTVAVYAPLIVFSLRWVLGYRIQGIEHVRRRFAAIRKSHQGPLLVCPNHLTMIDSAIIAWGLVSPFRYAMDYRLLPWNLPERTNFATPLVRVACYLAKCLPIRRGGARGPQREVFRKCVRLLHSGHPVLIFPEGRRSRTGKIDPEAMAHVTGRLVQSVPDCRVLCVYLRGEGQTDHSAIPRRGERFSMEIKLLRPSVVHRGVRASREITKSILAELAAMERAHDARRQ